MLRNTKNSYGSVTKWLHWASFLGFLAMFGLGIGHHYFHPPLKYNLINIHKTIGICILFAMTSRLAWRWNNPTPQLPSSIPFWHNTISLIGHYIIYLAGFGMLFSGWIMSTAENHAVNMYVLPKSRYRKN